MVREKVGWGARIDILLHEFEPNGTCFREWTNDEKSFNEKQVAQWREGTNFLRVTLSDPGQTNCTYGQRHVGKKNFHKR
jgi:hypothetical protein